MSAAQTMEAVSTTASTLMVLMSVSVEVATDCPAMEGTALVCSRMSSRHLCLNYHNYSLST